jgi:hypothetical protein
MNPEGVLHQPKLLLMSNPPEIRALTMIPGSRKKKGIGPAS